MIGIATMVWDHGRRKDFSILHINSSLVHSAILFFLAPCARRDADIKTFTVVLSYFNLFCSVIYLVTEEFS